MACPNCDHTLSSIGEVDVGGRRLFHCGRCGTLSVVGESGKPPIETILVTPALVTRCREFEKEIHEFHDLSGHTRYEITKNQWHRLGIAESINTPDNRPTT